MPDALITGFITLAASLLTASIAILANRRKVNADIASQLTSSASGLIKDLNKRIDDLQNEVERLRPLLDKVRDLEYQLRCSQTDQAFMQTQLTKAQGRIGVLERENAALRAAGSGA